MTSSADEELGRGLCVYDVISRPRTRARAMRILRHQPTKGEGEGYQSMTSLAGIRARAINL